MQQQNKASAQPQPQPTSTQQWHASEIAAPDPCNSSIKRISGKQVYLKDKPQALILLQAAEIERLTAYLNDYKCKYRSLSREPLDRQSYEIQIKQLFERDSNNKIEIERLNKSITTITVISQQYKKQLLSAQEKYKTVSNEKNVLGQKNIALQKQLQNTRENFDRFIKKSEAQVYSLNNQLTSHRIYTESVVKNNTDLVARVNTIPNYERRIFELETQVTFYIEQIQRLNKDIEGKTEKLINQERSYSTLFERHKNLQNTHEDLKSQLASHTKNLEESKLLISQLQGETEKVKALHEANVRESTLVLTKRNDDIDTLTKQILDYNLRWVENQKHTEELRRNIDLLESKNAVFVQQQVKQSETIKQLQQSLKKSQSDLASFQLLHQTKETEWQTAIQKQKSTLETEYSIKIKEFKDSHDQQIAKYSEILSRKEKELEELSKANHDLQRALQASKSQLKISQQIIKTQETEIEKLKKQEEELKSVTLEKNSLTRAIKEKGISISQLEKSLKQEREKQAELTAKSSKLNDDYEELKRRFQQENISLNKMINNKVTESESLKRQLINNENELRIQFESNLQAQSKSHAEKISKIHQEKQAIIDAHDGLKSQHSDLKAKHAEVSQGKEQLQKKHDELASEFANLSKLKIDLEGQIKENVSQITILTHTQELLKKQIEEKANRNQQLQEELKSQQTVLENSQNEIKKQKQELNRLRAASIKFNIERSCYDMEIYELKQETTKLKTEISKLKEQIANKEQQIAKLKEEREQLSLLFQNKTKQNEGLKRKMIELQAQLRDSFENALKEKESDHSKAYQLLSDEKAGLSKKIAQIEPHVALASELKKQKQILEVTFKNTIANHEVEKARNSTLTQQNEQLRKNFIDTQTKLKSYYQDELALKAKLCQQDVDRLSKELEQANKEKEQLKIERDSLFNMTTEYQERINQLLQEIDRLHIILTNNIAQNKSEVDMIRSTNTALKSQLTVLSEQLLAGNKREEELTTKYKLLTKRITTYEETLENIRSELVTIQLMTGELRQERDLLIKKNTILVKSIRTLSDELDSLEREGDSISSYFTKESSIHKELTTHFITVQDLLNKLEGSKVIIEEKTVEFTQVASK